MPLPTAPRKLKSPPATRPHRQMPAPRHARARDGGELNGDLIQTGGAGAENGEDSTFTGTAKAGLWTKSDSVIYFDDFQVVEQGGK
jgi:hypothetical protein